MSMVLSSPTPCMRKPSLLRAKALRLPWLAHRSPASCTSACTTAGGADVAMAAQRLATGDLAHASAILPRAGIPMLKASYADAFGRVLHLLAAITGSCALVVLAFLGRPGTVRDSSDAPWVAAVDTPEP
jgi:hypothetical protein